MSTSSSRASSRSASPFPVLEGSSPPLPPPPYHSLRRGSEDIPILHISLAHALANSRGAEGAGKDPERPPRLHEPGVVHTPLVPTSRTTHQGALAPIPIPNCDQGSDWKAPADWGLDDCDEKKGGRERRRKKPREVILDPAERARILEHHERIVEACRILGL